MLIYKKRMITWDYLSTNQWFKVSKMIQWSFIDMFKSKNIESTETPIYQWFEVWKSNQSSHQKMNKSWHKELKVSN